MHAIHANVLPFDRERPLVADVIERNDDVLELNVAVADRPKIPVASVVPEVGMTTEDPHITITMPPPSIFHMGVIDSFAELPNELHVVDTLIAKVGRIVVKAEALVTLDGFQSPMS